MRARASRRFAPRPFAGARARILAAFIILLAASEVVSLLAERQILVARTGERVDDSLVQERDEFQTLARRGIDPNTGDPFEGNVERLFTVFLERNVPGEGEAFFTFTREGLFAATAHDLPPELRERIARLGQSRTTRRGELVTPHQRLRYLVVPVEVDGEWRGTFVATVDLTGEEEEVRDVLRVTAGVALAVLLAATLLGWVIAGRVLAPLRTLRDTAQSITDTDLTQRIEVHGQDEIAELARTFNAMLDRLEAAFASQRALVSDAGHELRTPITIIRGHLELLGDDPEERRETLELVTDELDRMSRFVDDLLTLARSERGDFLQLEEIDLDVLTEELMAKATALAPRDWTLEHVGAGKLVADRQRLTQAVMNLAQNAVQHTQEGDRIAIGTALRGDHARLWVRDGGPGVPFADQDRIFERFSRAGNGRRRSEGAGLGLAIVRAIAEAHGGRVELLSRPGAGALFTVDVPTEPPTEVTP
jgi:signal transduction histidine kinase